MEQNKVRTYILYAIGEILLVVIGILIALQINNWNEYRNERMLERELLIQLQSEYQNNLQQLDEKILIRENMIQASGKLLDYIDDPVIHDADSTYSFIVWTIMRPTFDPIVNDIISSGRIQLIQNTELREKLTSFTSDVIQVTEEEVIWQFYVSNQYNPTLLNFGFSRNILDNFWKAELISSFQLGENISTMPDVGVSNRNPNINQLLDSKVFEGHVANCLTLSSLTNSQSFTLRANIVDILDIIEYELSNS